MEDSIKFATEVEAAQMSADFRPVMALLGYEIRGHQVIIPSVFDHMVPHVEYNSAYNEALTLKIRLSHSDTELELTSGMWLLKIGSTFTAMRHEDFTKIELAI